MCDTYSGIGRTLESDGPGQGPDAIAHGGEMREKLLTMEQPTRSRPGLKPELRRTNETGERGTVSTTCLDCNPVAYLINEAKKHIPGVKFPLKRRAALKASVFMGSLPVVENFSRNQGELQCPPRADISMAGFPVGTNGKW